MSPSARFDPLSPTSIRELVTTIHDGRRLERPELFEHAAEHAAEVTRTAGERGLHRESVLAHVVAHELRRICFSRRLTEESWGRVEDASRRLVALVGEPTEPRRRKESGFRRRVDVSENDPQIDELLDRVFLTG